MKLTVAGRRANTQILTDVPLNTRVRIVEGGRGRDGAVRAALGVAADARSPRQTALPPSATWMYEPFPAPDFSLPDLYGGRARSRR